jgi:hypothetical protein
MATEQHQGEVEPGDVEEHTSQEQMIQENPESTREADQSYLPDGDRSEDRNVEVLDTEDSGFGQVDGAGNTVESETAMPSEELEQSVSTPLHIISENDADYPTPHENQSETLETLETPSLESEAPAEQAQLEAQVNECLTRVSSIDSFHTTNSLYGDVPAEDADPMDHEKTPHVEKFDPFSADARQHRRGVSELTVTASTVDEQSEQNTDLRPSTSGSLEQPSTPALARSTTSDSSWPEVHTPSSPTVEGLRRRLNTKRSLSPLPPSATLFSPASPTQGNHFTAAILQKACNVALVKPVEAVVLLIHILARIAGGATVNDLLSGDLFRKPEQHRRSSSFPDQVSSPQDDSDDEDDFGVPIRGRPRREEVTPAAGTPKKDDDADSIFDLD